MSTLGDAALGLFVKVHDTIYQRTNGLIGHHIPGAPDSLLLHTVGAKTGQSRTNALSYARDGRDYLVVASNGGGDSAPGWYHNLNAHPRVSISVGRTQFVADATPVPADDPDYRRVWRIVNDNNSGRYDGYQAKTTRPIPVVRLSVVLPRAMPPRSVPPSASPR